MVHLLRGKLDGLLLPQPYFSRPATPTTWNPADKDSTITLSGGDLTAACSLGGDGAVRSVAGKTSGKWYWEVTVQTANNNEIIGVTSAGAGLAAVLGTSSGAWAYKAVDGNKVNAGTPAAYGAAYGNGDIISVLLDMDTAAVSFWKNGVSQGVAYGAGSLSGFGAIHAAFGGGSVSVTEQVTANFGASAFTYVPPPGYKRGLGT